MGPGDETDTKTASRASRGQAEAVAETKPEDQSGKERKQPGGKNAIGELRDGTGTKARRKRKARTPETDGKCVRPPQAGHAARQGGGAGRWCYGR